MQTSINDLIVFLNKANEKVEEYSKSQQFAKIIEASSKLESFVQNFIKHIPEENREYLLRMAEKELKESRHNN